MNKTIIELKEARTSKIEEMNGLKDNKELSVEDAQARFDELDKEIESLDSQIQKAERLELLNKSIAQSNPVKEESEEAKERYNLSKAISARMDGQPLTGVELEMHQEGCRERGVPSNGIVIPNMMLRATETKTTGATGGHIPTAVASTDFTVPNPLYKEVGCTIYNGLSGKVDIPFSDGHDAAFVAEAGTASESSPTNTKGTLSAERVQGWKKYSREYLAESVVMNDMISDMVQSLDRAISDKILQGVRDANELTGFVTGTDVTAAITWNGVLDIIASLTSDNFRKEGFVISKELFFELAAKERASNTAQFIVKEERGGSQKGDIFGVPAWGTSALGVQNTDDYAIAYGDFAKSYIGFWGGIEILVDPYTASDTGLVKITFSRLADTVVNPAGFASKTNVAIS
jgi:HK97 family phage major capsid protein